MTKLKARNDVLSVIRSHGPLSHASLPAYLSHSYTATVINKAVAELIYLERVAVSKERQLTAK